MRFFSCRTRIVVALWVLVEMFEPRHVWGAPASVVHLTLAACRARVVQMAPDVAVAAAEAQQGALAESVATAAMLPTLRAEAGYLRSSVGRQGTPDFAANNGRNEYIAQGLVSQPLFAGGALVGERQRAAASAAGARAGIAATTAQTILAADRAYFASLIADERRSIAVDTQHSAENLLRAARVRLGSGEIAALDVGRFELVASNAAAAVATAESDAAIARNDLATLLQLPVDEFDLGTPVDARTSSRPNLDDTAVAAVLAARPELQRLEADVRAAEAAVVVARGARLPQVRAEAGGGWDSLHAPDGRNVGWQAGVNLSLPVWDWNALARREEMARLDVEKARQRLEAARRAVRAEIVRRAQELRLAQRRLEQARVSEAVSGRNATAAQRGYGLGLVGVLDVVTAERDGMGARMERAVAQLAAALAESEYDYATGRLE